VTGPGHAALRLRERAGATAAERGFRLLRDRAALAQFVAARAAADHRYAVDIIALALEGGSAPAHVLVDRDGHGVTCLGPGMTATAPVVPWSAVAAWLDTRDRQLRAQRTALAARDAAPERSPLVRAVEHPHRLVRDEVLALRTLVPLLGVAHHGAAVEAALVEIVALSTGQRRSELALQASWRLVQGGVVGLVVAGGEAPLAGAALAAVTTGEPRLGAPALWQLVHHPETTLALAHALVDVDNRFAHAALLDTVLPCLGLRCPGYIRDADAVARRLQARNGDDVRGLEDGESAAVEFTRQLVLFLPLLLRHCCPNEVVLSHRAGIDELAMRLRAATTVADVERAAPPWAADVLRRWALPQRRMAPPRTEPRALRSLPDDERWALSLWRGALLAPPLPIRGAGRTFAELVVHAPIEALLPADDPEPALALGRGVAWLRDELPGLLGIPPTTTPPAAPRAAAAPRRRRR
jgi:hypothetical protein